ncbi:MAG: 23S rRNA (guanosine(2251)-2'-O)-methyltransferase RlmB [Gammaproteobacteria bacterium]|nr:23S rRNA (guanosine(2251)-2'-O)-methyltransferase RlmB [Gammaproteobacteria bacterium]
MSKQSEITCGIHAVRHALKNAAANVLEMWVLENKKPAKGISEILELAENAHVTVQFVANKTLDKLTHQANHQGVVIRRKIEVLNSKIDLASVLEIEDGGKALFLVLDGVQDPHNLGACLRTADAVGVRAIILPKDRAVGLNETVRKVACGAAENTPVIHVTNLSRALREMQDAGIWVIGTADEAENTIYEEDLTSSIAIVMGSEGQGLRQNTRKHCDKLVNIPMAGVVESLNVSVAAGVCLYEARRQRQLNN